MWFKLLINKILGLFFNTVTITVGKFFSVIVIVMLTNIFQLHLQSKSYLFFSHFKQLGLQSYGQRPKSEHERHKYQHSTV